MPLFFYKAINQTGENLEGEIDAANKEFVITKLQNDGCYPISISESPIKKTFTLPKFSLKRSKTITQKDITLLTRELATLLQAGLPLDTALDTLTRIANNPLISDLLHNISTDVKSGVTLSRSLEKQSNQFSPLYINTIRAGEAGGALDVVLDRLADYLERSSELRAHIFSSMFYPAILLCVSLVSIFILMIYVVPQFAPLFEDMGQSLPLLTQLIFASADFLKSYWWLFCGIFAATLWTADRLLKQEDYRYKWDSWLLTLPLISDLITRIELARFSRTFATLLSNGVSILSAISIVKEVISNKPLSDLMKEVKNSLEKGGQIAKPLKDSTLVPLLAIQLIEIGESTGQLETMLYKLANIYEDETKNTISRLLTLLEPVLIIGLGLIIAGIIVSILLAILGLNDLII